MKKILVAGLLLLMFSIVLVGCTTNNGGNNSIVEENPKTCAENIAMLQSAVDKYKVDVGKFPSELNQLIDDSASGWKGPYVDKVPDCPAGGIYKVTPDGRVTE